MARIRQVKPELRTSLTAAEWPREVRYAWVLLWGYLDDEGRGVDDLRLVVSDMFPLDRDVTEKKMDRWLDMWVKSGSLCRYEADGRHYMHALNWADHQKVYHPKPSRIPRCPAHELRATPPEPDPRDSGGPPELDPSPSGEPPEDHPSPSGDEPEDFPPRVRADQGSGIRDQGSGEKNARAPRTKRRSKIPDNLDLAGPRARYAHDHGMSRETAEREFATFRAWHSAKGGLYDDWDQTWLTWVLRWAKNTPKPPVQAHPDLPEGWA